MTYYEELQALSRKRDEALQRAKEAIWQEYYRELHELLAREDGQWMTPTQLFNASPNT